MWRSRPIDLPRAASNLDSEQLQNAPRPEEGLGARG
jgi:hypothetical protein